MTIAFVHNSQSFLPEIVAYTNYFRAKGIGCEVVKPEELSKLRPDVAWHFMGTDTGKKQAGITIHEYTSASTPPFMGIKNQTKKWINSRPDFRIFLNEYVRDQFDFKDGVPYGCRDMGVSREWLQDESNIEKEYDFIYIGEWRNRDITKLLDKVKDHSMLFVSKDYDSLQSQYPSIIFKGPISHHEIPSYIRRSRYAINYIPDVSPYNQQTSTKLLEYAACKVPVITTDYAWIRKFQKQYGGYYFFLSEDLSNLNWEKISHHQYSFPDLTEWTWEKQIERSGITDFLKGLH